MNTKTMEGLVGARTSMKILNTPFRVFKEARRRGDTATMERAMGYVNEYRDKADEYKAKADEGMEEDAKAAREREKLEREKAIQKRREEQKELDAKTEESKASDRAEVIVEVSEEGKILLKENPVTDTNNSDYGDSTKTTADRNNEPVTYTKTGEVSQSEQTTGISVSVSV
ncbi:MAG: hypothetical protein K2P35_02870 [Lachnospiraceae bacterium]|nr:hypothetical protein [Lachnospiraceae bacterium]